MMAWTSSGQYGKIPEQKNPRSAFLIGSESSRIFNFPDRAPVRILLLFRTSGRSSWHQVSESPLDFDDVVCFNHISYLHIIEACYVQTAVHTHSDFLDIVLESLE